MNIIQLFETIKLKPETLISLTPEEIIRVEKQLNVEKRFNENISTKACQDLIIALKNHNKALLFVCNNRILYNLFAKTDYLRSYFVNENIAIDEKVVQDFIEQFLHEDLNLFFDKNISSEKFDDVDYFLKTKNYLPENCLYYLNRKLFSKIDLSLNQINAKPKCLTTRNFYLTLNHFSSIDTDDKISELVNVSTDLYNKNTKDAYASLLLKTMANYDAFSYELKDLLKRNYRVVQDNINAKNVSSNDGYGWIKFVVMAIIVIFRIGVGFNRCSNSDNNYQNTTYPVLNLEDIENTRKESAENEILNKVFEETKEESAERKISNYNFQSYLNNTNADKKTITLVNKTNGKELFLSELNNKIYNPADSITKTINFTNNSSYDLIIFNTQEVDYVFHKEKITYIKSKKSVTLKILGTVNFYFGKKLAFFNSKNKEVNNFEDPTNGLIPRFLIQPKNKEKIIKKSFIISKNVVITEKINKLIINSELLYLTNPGTNSNASVDRCILN